MYSNTPLSLESKSRESSVDVKPRAFIVGPAGSGKSELARLMACHLAVIRPGYGFGQDLVGECGEVLIERLARIEAARARDRGHDVSVEKAAAYIRSLKQYHRGALRELGDQLTAERGVALIRPLADAPIICGVRRGREIEGLYDRGADAAIPILRDCAAARRHNWIYIFRPNAEQVSDSFQAEYFKNFCSHFVQNRFGDLEGLERRARDLVVEIFAS